MGYKHNPKLTENARTLRKNMTPEESKLWYGYLRNLPIRVLRQKVIDNYIVDFYCAKAKLVIELDGSQHYETAGLIKDTIRTQKLEKYSLTVLRIPNSEIHNNFDGVCEYLTDYINKRLNER